MNLKIALHDFSNIIEIITSINNILKRIRGSDVDNTCMYYSDDCPLSVNSIILLTANILFQANLGTSSSTGQR